MRNALITGGSRGIGLAIARKLAQDGFRCILVARNRSALALAASQIEKEYGQPVLTMTCDVRDEHDVKRTIDEAVAYAGRIHVLINCAGQGGGGITADIPTALWRDVIATNLDSVFLMSRTVLSQGIMPAGGRIINIASTGGKQGVLYGAPYSASKHGVVGLTKAWGMELARNGSGITMNAVCPGFVETEMAQKVRENYSKLWNVDEEEVKRRIEDRIPLGRYIQPDEVASMVSYLASEKAGGITAQALNVCGGLGNY